MSRGPIGSLKEYDQGAGRDYDTEYFGVGQRFVEEYQGKCRGKYETQPEDRVVNAGKTLTEAVKHQGKGDEGKYRYDNAVYDIRTAQVYAGCEEGNDQDSEQEKGALDKQIGLDRYPDLTCTFIDRIGSTDADEGIDGILEGRGDHPYIIHIKRGKARYLSGIDLTR